MLLSGLVRCLLCTVGLGLWGGFGGGGDIAVPSDKGSVEEDRRMILVFHPAVDMLASLLNFHHFDLSAREII